MLNSYNWHDEDGVIWRWNKSGVFSVKSFYSFLSNGGLICPYYKIICQNIAPLKVRLTLWLLLSDSLLTGKRLRLRHVPVEQFCVFCGFVEEDSVHIFLKCPYINFFWGFFKSVFQFRYMPTDINDCGLGGCFLVLCLVLGCYGIS